MRQVLALQDFRRPLACVGRNALPASDRETVLHPSKAIFAAGDAERPNHISPHQAADAPKENIRLGLNEAAGGCLVGVFGV